MPKLKKLLSGIKYKCQEEIPDLKIRKVSCNSKEIKPGDLFVAIKGTNLDGHKFIKDAVAAKAAAVVCEKDKDLAGSTPKILVRNSRQALSCIAKNFYNSNLDKIKLIAITGTNGKTTISLLINSILRQNNYRTAIVGTLGARTAGSKFEKLDNTTPSSLKLYELIDRMTEDNVAYGIMEVSSHALDQDRVSGLDFTAAIFSNLTEEHLDYHKNTRNYLKAKAKLFRSLGPERLAVINADDSASSYLKRATTARILTYALENEADFKAQAVKITLEGNQFILKTPRGEIPISSRLIGIHNIYNILAASGFCFHEGLSLIKIKEGIEALDVIPGRLQEVKEGQPFYVFIDYAHTHNALENVLRAIRQAVGRRSRIITVFGCGGDRDKSKRPKMAQAAARYSDFIIITTDNPRSEEPGKICDEILSGFSDRDSSKQTVILNREEAIQKALRYARENDVVLIAGKGHEDKQIFSDKIIKFSDLEVTKHLLRKGCRAYEAKRRFNNKSYRR
jgi:UDP-N-acetylmuramoyl-L-alanyl-D-glutamate--2,6-diaminopimelate ligase